MEPLNFGLLKEWLEEKKFFRVKDALTNRNEVDIAELDVYKRQPCTCVKNGKLCVLASASGAK